MSCPRVGHINFLNVLPLTYSYQHGYSEGLSMVYDVPSMLNQNIKNGLLDVSLISSIEYARQSKDLLILPNICIRADCDVESIVLISKKPVETIKNDKIVLTAKSATSHCLLKIIMTESYNASPDYQIRDVDIKKPIDDDVTASLLIGDDALYNYINTPDNLYCYDIGKEWYKLTRRSMVYAVWAVRKTFADELPEVLQMVYDKIILGMKEGLKNKDQAIKNSSKSNIFSYDVLNHYLGSVIKWNLNEYDLESLMMYYKLAYNLKLIEKIPQIEFAKVRRNFL